MIAPIGRLVVSEAEISWELSLLLASELGSRSVAVAVVVVTVG